MERADDSGHVAERHGLVESRMRWKSHVRFGGRAGETDRLKRRHGAPVLSHWATDALDELRREAWNEARGALNQRKAGRATGDAKKLKGARYALWKNPENLTTHQQAKLAWVAKTNPRLHRGYLLKEGLRFVFQVKGQAGKDALDRWLGWAQRCRIPVFVELGRKIRKHRAAIDATLDHGLSQGLIESTNTKIRVLTRMAYGFKSPQALIALALLALGGYRPALPGRRTAT
jgi:transposase